MPYDDPTADATDITTKSPPKTLGQAAQLLKKGEKNLTDEDLFGYLGHLGDDAATREGHNVGMPDTMREWKAGTLRSGSKKGPIVKSQKQAVAIGLSQERKMGKKIPKRK